MGFQSAFKVLVLVLLSAVTFKTSPAQPGKGRIIYKGWQLRLWLLVCVSFFFYFLILTQVPDVFFWIKPVR